MQSTEVNTHAISIGKKNHIVSKSRITPLFYSFIRVLPFSINEKIIKNIFFFWKLQMLAGIT